MNTGSTISIDDIYRMLLPLSDDNKRWLGERLIAGAVQQSKPHRTNALGFPHVKRDHKISKKTMSLVINACQQ